MSIRCFFIGTDTDTAHGEYLGEEDLPSLDRDTVLAYSAKYEAEPWLFINIRVDDKQLEGSRLI